MLDKEMGTYNARNRVLIGGANLNNIQNQFNEDNRIGQNNPDVYLFNLMLDLKKYGTHGLLARVVQFLDFNRDAINPEYIDPYYANKFGSEAASFFGIVSSMELINQDLKSTLYSKLLSIVNSYIDEVGFAEYESRVFLADKLCKFAGDSAVSNAAALKLTNNAYGISDLKMIHEHDPSLLQMFLCDGAVNGINSGLSAQCILNMGKKYTKHAEIFSVGTFLNRVLSVDNAAHINDNSLQRLMLEISEQDWFSLDSKDKFAFMNRLHDPQYFKLLVSKDVEGIVNSGLVPLDFLMSLDKPQLSDVINKRKMSEIAGALSYIVDNRISSYEASIASASTDGGNNIRHLDYAMARLRQNQLLKDGITSKLPAIEI